MSQSLSHAMLTTMMSAISAGIILMVLSHRLRVPAIVLLLAGGIVLGPQVLGVVQPETLGEGLTVLVSMAVGIILFEGGLSLDLNGYRQASGAIRGLLTIGVVVTWSAVAIILWGLFHFRPAFALLSASLVIVTGPTVIGPLLKRIRLKTSLHSILHWEGVLIDPIGVFIAILCFEWVSGQSGEAMLTHFALRIATGMIFGLAGGLAIDWSLRARLVPEDMSNVFTLGAAVLIFGLTEFVGGLLGFSEAGLLSVVVAGFVLGYRRPLGLKQIMRFKAEMTDVLIGMLFILLAARLEFDQFTHFGKKGAAAVAIVILVVRPLTVLLSSTRCTLTWKEKAFLGWVAPRGIVAASMASLFAINLAGSNQVKDPAFVETFTYSVIIATVVLQGFTAGPLAGLLGLKRPLPTGWMIVGAHRFGRAVARFIRDNADVSVVLVDLNYQHISEARAEGFAAVRTDARDREIEEFSELQDVGNLLALTDNEDLNALLCQRWAEVFGRDHLYRWHSSQHHAHDEEAAGARVWIALPKPSTISIEMARGESSLVVVARPGPATGNKGLEPLMSVREGLPVLDPAKSGDLDDQRLETTMYLKREVGRLSRCIKPELVLSLETQDIDALFGAMVDRAVSVYPELPADRIKEQLRTREDFFSSALGRGLAVPHTHCPYLKNRVCVVARVPGGAAFEPPDDVPVTLVFLVLSPPNDLEGHLATVAEIARIGMDRELAQSLVNEGDPVRLYRLIQNADLRGLVESGGTGISPADYDEPDFPTPPLV